MTSALTIRALRNEEYPFPRKPFEIESCVEFMRQLVAR